MNRTSIRELKHSTSQVLEKVRLGESLEITRHNEVVAVLSPPNRKGSGRIARPDFAQRLKDQWGDRVLSKTTTEVIREEHGDR
ncbi:MAG: type II toxin-antitoxin system prevent-host-death family antitoxin [Verrucomicrobiales bacterium]|nr:type II toxin-antitoxin system prevent-host-death family antitoxin [Verrucomicrobiales bacterium]